MPTGPYRVTELFRVPTVSELDARRVEFEPIHIPENYQPGPTLFNPQRTPHGYQAKPGEYNAETWATHIVEQAVKVGGTVAWSGSGEYFGLPRATIALVG